MKNISKYSSNACHISRNLLIFEIVQLRVSCWEMKYRVDTFDCIRLENNVNILIKFPENGMSQI